MQVKIGSFKTQKEGFKAFVPDPFPPKGILDVPVEIQLKADKAARLIGKLDGITHDLPDVNFFLYMFMIKDAEASAQIEGTRATIVDAIKKNVGVGAEETDADDIIFYIKAMNFGLKRTEKFPLSLRLMREIHEQLMVGARCTQSSYPGEFRRSQNWIGGKTPSDAEYVPPTVDEMNKALGNLEKFLHNENTLPLVQAGLAHAQFETIHPFNDGNGRTGRMLVTLLLNHREILEHPVLFLSSYFRKYKKVYYEMLNRYHSGEVEKWLNFFLDGIVETANESIEICKKITLLRHKDMEKIQGLGKRESESGVIVLQNLFKQPIVGTAVIMKWTGFTRAGAQRVIDRFVSLGILKLRDEEKTYDRSYVYLKYLSIFVEDEQKS